ncbi:helix-turn-helix domain-containing protein [Anaerotignum sp.]|uniref:helix-turn-helix domain-containing protein n=1 Tax=Anaerotignum sp. TaxID=2039241 RepID=UPI0028A23250|nr:helix-turn-helix transcriptional regulator [Anaerotignum sp.]
MNYKQIGNKIREFRMEKNLTQEEFAEQIGISVSYVGQIERGQRKASIKTLESIGSRLEVPLPVLICELKEAEHISCIWNEKAEKLSVEDKKTMLIVFEMILDMLNANRKEERF